MKKGQLTVRSLAYLVFSGMSLFLISSCNSDKPEDPKDVAEEQNDDHFDDRKSEKDAQFLVEAAAINMEEIKLGELAETKAVSADVKALAKMMVKEHTAALKDLKKLAASKNIVLPTTLTEDGQEAYDDLADEETKDFDKEYCSMMVKGHKNAINKFEKASSNAEDADIRNWASSMLPALKEHLQHSQSCEDMAK